MKEKLAVVFGTRPEIIKLYTLISALRSYFDVIIIHTGQHYSKELNQNQLDIFNLKIDHQIESFDSDPNIQLSNMIKGVSLKLKEINPKAVLVHGDTNSTLSGAIAARKSNIPLIHIESGARCFDKDVPEEQNRIVADHFANFNFCYDKESQMNLKKEGIKKNVFVFSNTAYSSCHYINKKYLSNQKNTNQNILVTIHRAENTDDLKKLKAIVGLLNQLAQTNKIIFPMHPRTKKILAQNSLKLADEIDVQSPVDYLDFLKLIKQSYLIISDSGGVVDESVYFNVPLIILRKNTERNELVKSKKIKQLNPEVGEKKLTSLVQKIIKTDLKKMKKKKINFDVHCAQKMAKTIFKNMK